MENEFDFIPLIKRYCEVIARLQKKMSSETRKGQISRANKTKKTIVYCEHYLCYALSSAALQEGRNDDIWL